MLKPSTLAYIGMFIFLCSMSLAQEEDKGRAVTIKAYANGYYEYAEKFYSQVPSWFPYRYPYGHNVEIEDYHIGALSVAMAFKDSRYFTRELEVMPLNIQHEQETIIKNNRDFTLPANVINLKNRTLNSYVRAQLTHSYNEDGKFKPNFGLSLAAYYKYSKIESYATYFNEETHTLGLLFNVIPGFCYHINDKVSLDLNIPFGIYNFDINRQGSNESVIYFISDKLFPTKYHIRVGICYTL